MFYDNIEGSCVSGNDYHIGLNIRLTFNAVDTETYIVYVTGYGNEVG